jgi:hypothetical protein
MWVVPWLRRLDLAQGTFEKTEPTLQSLSLKASEYVHRQLWFTPFPTEDVAWMTGQCGDDLFMFSSDYDAARDCFYRGNYADMMGWS